MCVCVCVCVCVCEIERERDREREREGEREREREREFVRNSCHHSVCLSSCGLYNTMVSCQRTGHFEAIIM